MSRRHQAFRRLCAALVLCMSAASCAFITSAVPRTPSTSAQALAIDLAGNPLDPLKASPGKVVILIFVRTDCPISNRYAPTIQKLSAEYAGKVSFWLVYPARAESAEMIRKHEHDFGYTLPALRDVQHSLVKLSRVSITPEAAVFDANRQLIYHGRIDDLYQDFGRARPAPTTHELDDAIRAATAGKVPAADTAPAVGCYISDLE
jgi:thiol-disulfide isomerase/thioredoxin